MSDKIEKATTGLDFGDAIRYLKQGQRMARAGWNGKKMFIYLVSGFDVGYADLRGPARDAAILAAKLDEEPVGADRKISGHIDMIAADGSIVVGWLASQTDMLAEDWQVIE